MELKNLLMRKNNFYWEICIQNKQETLLSWALYMLAYTLYSLASLQYSLNKVLKACELIKIQVTEIRSISMCFYYRQINISDAFKNIPTS